ncbi:MAG TPA: phage tail protein [Puia sp.]|jgi:phage tail-like protein|nr:phage tail protein [Puia sp.]
MSSSGTVYQTVNFHFKVQFSFDSGGNSVDVRFQSVTGLDATLETEQLKEGGENLFTHMLPVRRKFGPLVLKRGLLKPGDSTLTAFLKNAFENDVFKPIQLVTIHLLDETHQSMVHWQVDNVWPLSWKIAELNAMEGAILIETLELNYNHLLYTNISTNS